MTASCRRNAGPVRGVGLLAACLLGLLLAACGPIQGETGEFVAQPTTNGDFQAPTYVALGNLPITMELTTSGGLLDLLAAVNNVADPALNADGTYNAAGSLSVVRNDGTGTFTTLADITTAQFPTRALWANLDGTPEQDLVLLDNQNLHVAIYRSTSAGTWPATPSQEFTFTHAVDQLSVVDLNGDGFDDVVLTRPEDTEFEALLNAGDGTGTLTEVKTTALTGLSSFLAADLNGDGLVDLAILRPLANVMQFWQGAGNGTFAQTLPSTTLIVQSRAVNIAGGSFLSANYDVALLSDTGNVDTNTVTVYANDGTGNFTASAPFLVRQKAHQIFALDAVAGGGLDLLTTHRNERFVSLLSSSGGTLAFTEYETTRNPVAAVAGDVTGDGITDLIIAEADRRVIGVLAGDGAGAFTRTQLGLETRSLFPRVIDVNGDGKLDLLLLQPDSDRVAVYLNAH